MLETKANMCATGVINIDGSGVVIYCDVRTGECAFELPTGDLPQLVAEVSVTNPMEISDVDKMLDSVQKIGAIGIILKEDGNAIVILDEDTAVERPMSSLGVGGTPFEIDLSSEYEYADEDESGELSL